VAAGWRRRPPGSPCEGFITPNHQSARSPFERHQGECLLTTNHVRGETWTLVNRREGHAAAVRFLDAVAASPRLPVVQVAESHEATALAYDGDFAAAGFVELR
jgi:predicted nucleic acid-binding protein